MHITELLNMDIADFAKERSRMDKLLNMEVGGAWDGYVSLKQMIEPHFMKCPIRGTAISIDDLFETYSKHWAANTLEGLLLYCEIISNLIYTLPSNYLTDHDICRNRDQIISNVKYILEKTGNQLVVGAGKVLIVVPKDALVNAAIEDISDKDVGLAILEYGRFSNKGNLKRKRETLVKIARLLEPKLKDNKLTEPRKSLADNIDFVLNNFNIRHNNEAGKSANVLLPELTAQMLEIVYDDLYQAMLLFFEFEKYAPGSERFVKLRKLLKERMEEVKKKGV